MNSTPANSILKNFIDIFSGRVNLITTSKQKKNLITLIVLVVGLVSGLILVQRVQELREKALTGGPELSFTASPLSVAPGSTGNVYDIYMNTNGFEVTAAVIEVQFDTSMIQVTSISKGDALTDVLVPGAVSTNTASITLGSGPSTPFNGTGKIATLTFNTVAQSGQTDINFTQNTQVAAVGHPGNVLGTTTPGRVVIGAGAPTPKPTATPTVPPPTSIPTNAFLGLYYDNQDFTNLVLTRIDSAIDFDWGRGSPAPSVGVDSFSVRWEGDWNFAQAGTYRFTAETDDGIRVFVDGQQIIDDWNSQPVTVNTADINLSAGTHRIKVEYFEDNSPAVARLSWALIAIPPPGASTPTPTPTGPPPPSPIPTPPTAVPTNAFLGQYYDNQDFTDLEHTRIDPAINFDWGLGSPAPSVGVDSFSVRWEGDWNFAQTGTYRFTAEIDDGMRVWVDGQQVINSWKNQPVTVYNGDLLLSSGTHRVKVEYYEAHSPAVARLSWALTAAPPSPLTGDINRDRVVDILDFQIFSNAFGTSDPTGDINQDGVVNILDFQILSNNFGRAQ